MTSRAADTRAPRRNLVTLTEAERKRVRYYERRQRGVCTSCPNPAVRSLCHVCAEKNLRRVTERIKHARAMP